MNFLNPWYLVAALAALVPLIIHLLHRQRARIEVFPSLEFLRKMMRKRTRRFRLKQILLLVMRTLLVLLIALALARPTLTGGRAVRGHLPTTAVVILDDSFSMARRAEGGTLFDLARDKAARGAAALRPGGRGLPPDRIVARQESLGGLGHPRRRGACGERLGEASATNLATDLRGPLEAARRVLAKSANPNKEIYIVSDMQKVGWEGLERGCVRDGEAVIRGAEPDGEQARGERNPGPGAGDRPGRGRGQRLRRRRRLPDSLGQR